MTSLYTARVLLQTSAFCTVIAVVLWLCVPAIGQHGLWASFVHSQAIGLCIATLVTVSMGWLVRRNRDTLAYRGVALALATGLGLVCGLTLSAWVLDIPSTAGSHAFEDSTLAVTVVTAIVASTGLNWYFSSEHKMVSLKLEASEHARQAERAKTALLQAQLEPHMLFNTLANLRALIRSDTDRALAMLDHLDGFLRASLTSSQQPFHTLASELALIEDYLALVQVRFGDRLAVTKSIPPEALSLEVPSLLLQPLVENAVKHGVEPALDGGTVSLIATVTATELQLCVANTGAPYAPGPGAHHGGGFGLAHVEERLAALYAGRAVVEIDTRPEDGAARTRVTLTLPRPDTAQPS
ncbi:MAG: histidine kinase [Pseudomonadota bacterium]